MRRRRRSAENTKFHQFDAEASRPRSPKRPSAISGGVVATELSANGREPDHVEIPKQKRKSPAHRKGAKRASEEESVKLNVVEAEPDQNPVHTGVNLKHPMESTDSSKGRAADGEIGNVSKLDGSAATEDESVFDNYMVNRA